MRHNHRDALTPNDAAAAAHCVRVPRLVASDGDELYHTTWQNIEGETIVSAPVSGTLVSLHERAAAVAPGAEHYERMDDLDETDWLALLHVDRPALQSARLVGEDAYREHCRALGPGAFGSEGYRD